MLQSVANVVVRRIAARQIIACIESPLVIKKILEHLDAKSDTPVNHLPESDLTPIFPKKWTGQTPSEYRSENRSPTLLTS
jgi:hypothetical protein